MDILDIKHNGSGYDEEYDFKNYALTIVLKEGDREKTVRANLHYFPQKEEWDINPIFYEFSEEEKQYLIDQIVSSGKLEM